MCDEGAKKSSVEKREGLLKRKALKQEKNLVLRIPCSKKVQTKKFKTASN